MSYLVGKPQDRFSRDEAHICPVDSYIFIIRISPCPILGVSVYFFFLSFILFLIDIHVSKHVIRRGVWSGSTLFA